jgi:hypothetical protein
MNFVDIFIPLPELVTKASQLVVQYTRDHLKGCSGYFLVLVLLTFSSVRVLPFVCFVLWFLVRFK